MDREQPPRMPFVDGNGMITREWWRWLYEMFGQVEENTFTGLDVDGSLLALSERIDVLEQTDADEPQIHESSDLEEDRSDVRAIAEMALQEAKAALALLPVGCIIAWGKNISDIPDGWQHCDGTNGTPDLRNVFIVGSQTDSGGGGQFKTGDTGGSTIDTTTGPSAPPTSVDNNGDASTTTVASDSHTHVADILPPYHSRAWIMRVA